MDSDGTSKGHYCQAEAQCGKKVTCKGGNCGDVADGDYDIVCEGEIGTPCTVPDDGKTCNQAFKYQCGQWIGADNHTAIGYKCLNPVNCNKTVAIDGKQVELVCGSDGFLGSSCDVSKDTCNSAFKFKCADWVDSKTNQSVGFECQDPANCDKTYTDAKGNYSIVCDGYIGETCAAKTDCNTKQGYECADWVSTPKDKPHMS